MQSNHGVRWLWRSPVLSGKEQGSTLVLRKGKGRTDAGGCFRLSAVWARAVCDNPTALKISSQWKGATTQLPYENGLMSITQKQICKRGQFDLKSSYETGETKSSLHWCFDEEIRELLVVCFSLFRSFSIFGA